MSKQKVLTISVLTSRKKEQVRRCLESLKPIREALDTELVIVDTSEDEDMGKLVREYADKVVPFHWINDFSAARNAGLREATGEWFIYLDDDEWFGDCRSIIRFFQSGAYRRFNGGMYYQRNYSNAEGTEWSDDWVSRMAKVTPQLKFVSPIHEHFDPVPDENMALKSYVHHYGYVFATPEDNLAHFERNRVLLEDILKKEPGSVRWRMQMLQEYRGVGKFDEMAALARESLNYFEGKDSEDIRIGIPVFYAARIENAEEWDRRDLAYRACIEAEEDPRTTRMGQAYMDNLRIGYELERGDYRQAELAALRYFEADKFFEKNEEEKLKQGFPVFMMNTFKDHFKKRAMAGIIRAGLGQGNPVYLRQYFDGLCEGKVYEDIMTGLFETMVEAMSAIDLGKHYERAVRKLRENGELWQLFETALLNHSINKGTGMDRLCGILKKAGADPSFLAFFALRKCLSEMNEDLSGEALEDLFREYVSLARTYYAGMYTSAQEDELSGELKEDYRAALLLEQILADEDDEKDIRPRLDLLKQVVEAYPPFAEAVKGYMAYLGERLSGATDAAEQDRDESPYTSNAQLEQMAQQVLDSVRTMLDGGMYGEALQVIGQLKAMLPGNQEILDLEQRILRKQGE